jgi:hypothetical protein
MISNGSGPLFRGEPTRPSADLPREATTLPECPLNAKPRLEFPREDEMFGVRSALWRIWTVAGLVIAAAAVTAGLISLAAIC